MDIEKIFYFGSYIVSLSTAYYTLVVRIVKLESKTENFDKLVSRLESDLSEIKKDIKEIRDKIK
jgi:predicted  nucleic acid-binding Zn-ribbon protein